VDDCNHKISNLHSRRKCLSDCAGNIVPAKPAAGCLKIKMQSSLHSTGAPTCGYSERITSAGAELLSSMARCCCPGRNTTKRSMVPRHTTTFDQTDCTLAPGELIEQSGIYEICHQDEPRASVILMRNSIFPFCRRCGDMVRYKILELVPHISEDPDFQEDPPETDNPSHKMMIPTPTFPMQLGRAHGFRFQQDCLQTWSGGPQGGDL
jgi:hypothetical protein